MSKISQVTLAAIALATAVSAGYEPTCWDSNWVFGSQLQDKWGQLRDVQRISTKQDQDGIDSVIRTCYSADTGEQQDESVCIKEITEAMVACAVSSIAYHGDMQQTKREEFSSSFVNSLGKNDLQVHAVYDDGKDITKDTQASTLSTSNSSPNYTLKQDKSYSLTKSGSKKTVSALVSSKRSKQDKSLPFVITSDGESTHIGHTSVVSKSKRDDDPSQITGWELRQDGAGVKVLSNSDPIATYDDAVNWLNTEDSEFDTVLGGYIDGVKGKYVGGALAKEKSDNWYDGQWMAIVQHKKFDQGWKTGMNWCYSVSPTNCDDNAQCPKIEDLPSKA